MPNGATLIIFSPGPVPTFMSPCLQGELRCDLHPCWDRNYTRVAIDSIHNKGKRQVYIVDIGELS